MLFETLHGCRDVSHARDDGGKRGCHPFQIATGFTEAFRVEQASPTRPFLLQKSKPSKHTEILVHSPWPAALDRLRSTGRKTIR